MISLTAGKFEFGETLIMITPAFPSRRPSFHCSTGPCTYDLKPEQMQGWSALNDLGRSVQNHLDAYEVSPQVIILYLYLL